MSNPKYYFLMAIAGNILKSLARSKAPVNIPIRVVGSDVPEHISRIVADRLGVLAKKYPETAKRLSGGVDLVGRSEIKAGGIIDDMKYGGFYDVYERKMGLNAASLDDGFRGEQYNPGFSVPETAKGGKEYVDRVVSHEFGHALHYTALDRFVKPLGEGASTLEKIMYRGDHHLVSDAMSQALNAGSPTRIVNAIGSQYAAKSNTLEEAAELFTHGEHVGGHVGMKNAFDRLTGWAEEGLAETEEAIVRRNIQGLANNSRSTVPAAASLRNSRGRLADARRRSGAFINQRISSARQGLPVRSAKYKGGHL